MPPDSSAGSRSWPARPGGMFEARDSSRLGRQRRAHGGALACRLGPLCRREPPTWRSWRSARSSSLTAREPPRLCRRLCPRQRGRGCKPPCRLWPHRLSRSAPGARRGDLDTWRNNVQTHTRPARKLCRHDQYACLHLLQLGLILYMFLLVVNQNSEGRPSLLKSVDSWCRTNVEWCVRRACARAPGAR